MLSIVGKIPSNLKGIIYIMLSAALLTLMATIVRFLSEELNPFQIAFCRNVFGLILLAPLLMRFGLSHLRTEKIGYMAVRGVFNAVAMLTYFLALGLLPLSEVSALTFTVPLFVAVLAVMCLGERLGPRRISSLVIGFSGALIILRPGIEIIGIGAVYALFSAATWAVAVIIIKFLSRTESSITITIYGLFFLAIFTMPPALFVWEWPTGEQYFWLVTLALAGTIGQLLFAQSMKEADATLVMPFDFTKLIWASLFGFFIFSEIPTIWTIAGGLIIFSSATYLTYREGKETKPASSPAL